MAATAIFTTRRPCPDGQPRAKVLAPWRRPLARRRGPPKPPGSCGSVGTCAREAWVLLLRLPVGLLARPAPSGTPGASRCCLKLRLPGATASVVVALPPEPVVMNRNVLDRSSLVSDSCDSHDLPPTSSHGVWLSERVQNGERDSRSSIVSEQATLGHRLAKRPAVCDCLYLRSGRQGAIAGGRIDGMKRPAATGATLCGP